MRFKFLILFSVITLFSQGQGLNYTPFVNPMIGTGGHGHTFPGATLPFGMVQLSPDTRIDGSWDGCSGYHHSDSVIYGFSHTHLSGTGCSDYGDIAFSLGHLTPASGVGFVELDEKNEMTFSHKNEISKAGYYSVKLSNGIKVELTSTIRVGLQQYTYSQNGYAWITLNLKHRDELLEGKITQINKHTFSGLRRSKAWAENQLVFYYFEVSRNADTIIISKNERGETKINLGYKVKVGDKILIKTALSSVDEAGAKANMDKELHHWNFEKVKQDANKAWNTELAKIKVYGGTKDEKINFYTALYHCMIHPNVMNDVDGRYMGRDKKIHTADSFNYYTVFSLWDTYRALHPLLNIIDKKRSHDFIKTFQAQYEQSGRLPMWELWGNETNCMIGFHSVSVILDAYNKGVITKDELKTIYPAVKAEAMSNRFGLDKFREKGFLSIEDESESVSKTLEYSYDFYCVSEIAGKLGMNGDKVYFEKLSNGWRNVRDINSNFMRPRKNGGWLTPFDPKQVNNHYTEANGWQYSFAIPHDIREVNYWNNLSELFNTDSKTTGREQSDITGMIGQYAHGNEPSHHIPYLFNNIDSTSKYIKKICNDLYKPAPDGLCGNEDCGQMSAWYVFSALGFYPSCPVFNRYNFGKMIFDSAKVRSDNFNFDLFKNIQDIENKPNFKKYVTKNNLEFENSYSFYINKNEPLYINGYESFSKEYSNIGVISENYGYRDFISSPIIINNSMVFNDSIRVEIILNNKQIPTDNYIFYKIDDGSFLKYKNPFVIYKNCKITAFHSILESQKALYKYNYPTISDTSFAHFYKKPNNYTIKINSTYNKQYTADGDEGLIDGLLGETDWRKGRWQGYQGQDFEAIVDLQKETFISEIGAEFLQDTRSWILMPAQLTVETSVDGINFKNAGNVKNQLADTSYTVEIKNLVLKINPVQARYVKIKAINYGKLPSWHQGAGGDAFIFVDEIFVK